MARRTTQLAYQAIRIEGGLIPADELARLTSLQNPDRTEQTETYYNIPKGLKLRDEIARYWKIALNLWADFQPQRQRTDLDAHDLTLREFLLPLLRNALGYADLKTGVVIEASGHAYNIGHLSGDGRVPLILAAHGQDLDAPADRFGETNPETGKIRRRSPFMLAQEALNASDASLWAIVSNGLRLRILRDNPSLTRPVYVEVDLEAIFNVLAAEILPGIQLQAEPFKVQVFALGDDPSAMRPRGRRRSPMSLAMYPFFSSAARWPRTALTLDRPRASPISRKVGGKPRSRR